jgi:hypothetical protein
VSADGGHRIRVGVEAHNSKGNEQQTSAPTAVVQTTAPVNTSRPVVSGTTRQGATLHTSTGGWSSGTALTFRYQWARCDANGRNCAPIAGATQAAYVLTVADVGRRLIVQVKALNSGGASYADSAPTNVIAAASRPVAPPPPPAGTMAVGSVSLPDRLVIDKVQFDPKRIRSRQQPLIARFHVRETRGGRSVSGAVVYAFGVPFNRLSKAPKVRTDGTGWATVIFRVMPAFPLRKGYSVVVLVRVTKPGGSVLAGVSARRFTSVRVG